MGQKIPKQDPLQYGRKERNNRHKIKLAELLVPKKLTKCFKRTLKLSLE